MMSLDRAPSNRDMIDDHISEILAAKEQVRTNRQKRKFEAWVRKQYKMPSNGLQDNTACICSHHGGTYICVYLRDAGAAVIAALKKQDGIANTAKLLEIQEGGGSALLVFEHVSSIPNHELTEDQFRTIFAQIVHGIVALNAIGLTSLHMGYDSELGVGKVVGSIKRAHTKNNSQTKDLRDAMLKYYRLEHVDSFAHLNRLFEDESERLSALSHDAKELLIMLFDEPCPSISEVQATAFLSQTRPRLEETL